MAIDNLLLYGSTIELLSPAMYEYMNEIWVQGGLNNTYLQSKCLEGWVRQEDHKFKSSLSYKESLYLHNILLNHKLFKFFDYIYLCTGDNTHATVPVWDSEDNFEQLDHFSRHVRPREWTQVVRLIRESLYLLNHLTDPIKVKLSQGKGTKTRYETLGIYQLKLIAFMMDPNDALVWK